MTMAEEFGPYYAALAARDAGLTHFAEAGALVTAELKPPDCPPSFAVRGPREEERRAAFAAVGAAHAALADAYVALATVPWPGVPGVHEGGDDAARAE